MERLFETIQLFFSRLRSLGAVVSGQKLAQMEHSNSICS